MTYTFIFRQATENVEQSHWVSGQFAEKSSPHFVYLRMSKAQSAAAKTSCKATSTGPNG